VGFGKENTEIKCHLHSIISKVHTINMIYECCVGLDHLLAKEVFVFYLFIYFCGVGFCLLLLRQNLTM
jgi:hypothetical protein